MIAFAWICVGVLFLWAVGALYFLTTVPYSLRCLFTLTYVVVAVYSFRRFQSRSRWLSMIAVSIIFVYLITLTQRPSNTRDWTPEQATLANIQVSGTSVEIQNVRECDYQTATDFSVRHRNLHFELNQLTRVWFIVQKFTAFHGIAHTFVSFEASTPEGPKFFCVSVEVRRERGEVYSPALGLYRQFELMYVIADERDGIGSRTVLRPSDRVYLYPVNAKSQDAQKLFLEISARVQSLQTRPEFYHTLLKNCTNAIVGHTYKLTPEPINWLDPRIIAPGYSAKFAFSQGLIGSADQTFAELEQQCRIDEKARAAGLVEDFSQMIRK
jgi:fumarate reductase subunit C